MYMTLWSTSWYLSTITLLQEIDYDLFELVRPVMSQCQPLNIP
jgi:hypothetical protein